MVRWRIHGLENFVHIVQKQYETTIPWGRNLSETSRLLLDLELLVTMKRVVGITIIIQVRHRKRKELVAHARFCHLILFHLVEKVKEIFLSLHLLSQLYYFVLVHFLFMIIRGGNRKRQELISLYKE